MVEMIKLLAHQTNEHYLDLSKRLKKVEERVIKGVEEAIAKEVQPLKDSIHALHKDIKNTRILVKNIKTSFASSKDEYSSMDEEDKCSDGFPKVPRSDKPS